MFIKYLIIILCSFIFAFTIFILMKRNNKNIVDCNYNYISLILIAIFSILFPICYFLSIIGFNNNELYIKYFLDFQEFELFYYYFIIFIVSHTFLFVLRKKSINLNSIGKIENKSFKYNKRIKITAVIMLIIGFVSNYLYLKAYGSYSNYLQYSGLIRSGILTVNNPFSFLMPLRNCINFSSLLFFSLIVNKKSKKTDILFFLISFIFSILVLYSNKGRLSFVFYFFSIFLFYIFKKNKTNVINLKSIAKISFLIILLFIGLIISGNIMQRNSMNSIILEINEEISFIFLNFKVMLSKGITLENYRMFKDVLYMPMYFLPSSIWSSKFGIITCDQINTKIWTGFYKGENGITGTIPIDFISFSYIQMGLIGIFIVPTIYAFFCSKILDIINKVNDENNFKMIYSYVLTNIVLVSFFYADPYHIISGCYSFILFIIIYNVIRLFKIE